MQIYKIGGAALTKSLDVQTIESIIKQEATKTQTIIVTSAVADTTDKLLKAGQLAAIGDDNFRNIFKDIEALHIEWAYDLIDIRHRSGILSELKSQLNSVESILDGINTIGELSSKSTAMLLSFGERLITKIIYARFKEKGISITLWSAKDIITSSDSYFESSCIDFDTTYRKTLANLERTDSDVIVMSGFIGSNNRGELITLGRGGADLTASIIAKAVNASELHIWSDRCGIDSANIEYVKEAKTIEHLSYQETLELLHFGADILYPPTIQPAMDIGVPIKLRNILDPNRVGTTISNSCENYKKRVKGISGVNNITLLTLEGSGMIGVPGFSHRLFGALSSASINIIIITQGSSENSISIGVSKKDGLRAKEIVDLEFRYDIELKRVKPLTLESDLSIIALVGDNMKDHQGVSGRLFTSLGQNGISIRAIAQGSSERNITAVIDSRDIKKALNIVHEEFFESQMKQLNLFIVGVGNVGGKLIEQLNSQKEWLKKRLNIQVNIVGLANSRQALLNDDGIDLNSWREDLQQAPNITLDKFVESAISMNRRNSIFVDNTASKIVSLKYEECIREGFSIVTCNKIACSSEYTRYRELKNLTQEYQTSFLYETNVGAGLPIIRTLNDLISSGDRVTRIEAILSGSLNFIFNNYQRESRFVDIVKQASVEGYTEPDPREDLGFMDVMRKILILARECGNKIDIDDIKCFPILSESYFQADSVDEFYNLLDRGEETFKTLLESSIDSNTKLKVIAEYYNGEASVKLKEISPDSPLYSSEGKDNIVLFHTERYSDQPLVIKGAGAGADVTASGIFADIIKSAGY